MPAPAHFPPWSRFRESPSSSAFDHVYTPRSVRSWLKRWFTSTCKRVVVAVPSRKPCPGIREAKDSPSAFPPGCRNDPAGTAAFASGAGKLAGYAPGQAMPGRPSASAYCRRRRSARDIRAIRHIPPSARCSASLPARARNEYEISVGIFASGCTPPGTSSALAGIGAAGSIGKLDTGKRSDAVRRIERRVLIHPVSEIVLQLVVHAESGANNRLVLAWIPRKPDPRLGKKLRVVRRERADRPTCGWLEITPFVNV